MRLRPLELTLNLLNVALTGLCFKGCCHAWCRHRCNLLLACVDVGQTAFHARAGNFHVDLHGLRNKSVCGLLKLVIETGTPT